MHSPPSNNENRTGSSNGYDSEDDGEVDDEAKDEDSKRHDLDANFDEDSTRKINTESLADNMLSCSDIPPPTESPPPPPIEELIPASSSQVIRSNSSNSINSSTTTTSSTGTGSSSNTSSERNGDSEMASKVIDETFFRFSLHQDTSPTRSDHPNSRPSSPCKVKSQKANSHTHTNNLLLNSKLASQVVNEIVAFVTDVDEQSSQIKGVAELQKALYCQVKRTEMRLRGIKDIFSLLQSQDLVSSVKYYLLCGWHGLMGHGKVGQDLSLIHI